MNCLSALHSRVELVGIASSRFGVHPATLDAARLTAAERDVLDLLRRGLPNAEIARLRNRSRHTVANQVSAILAKTRTPSRRSLAASHPSDGT